MARDGDVPMAPASSARGPSGPTKEEMAHQIQALQAQLEEANVKLAKKITINAPEPYKGERGKLNNFLGQVELYVANYPPGALTESGKVMMAASYLREKAFEWFEPHMTEWSGTQGSPSEPTTKRIFSSYTYFTEALQQRFGDVDRKRATERKIWHLTQKGSASEYASKFQAYIGTAQWQDEDTNMALFERGLKVEVQYELVKAGPYKNLVTMIQKAIQIDNQLYEFRKIKQGSKHVRYASHSGRRNHDDEDRMELDATIPRKGDTEEIKKCREKNLCFNCQKPGHKANKCPQKKHKKQLRATKIKTESDEKGRGGYNQQHQLRATIQKGPAEKKRMEQHKKLHWVDCEARQQRVTGNKLTAISCYQHWHEKMKDVKNPQHPQHSDLPTWECDCKLHLLLQEAHKEATRKNMDHFQHGQWGCEVEACQRCYEEWTDPEIPDETPELSADEYVEVEPLTIREKGKEIECLPAYGMTECENPACSECKEISLAEEQDPSDTIAEASKIREQIHQRMNRQLEIEINHTHTFTRCRDDNCSSGIGDIILTGNGTHPEWGNQGKTVLSCLNCDQHRLGALPYDNTGEPRDETDTSDSRHPLHGWTSWAFCWDDDCKTHLSDKMGADYWPRRIRKAEKKNSDDSDSGSETMTYSINQHHWHEGKGRLHRCRKARCDKRVAEITMDPTWKYEAIELRKLLGRSADGYKTWLFLIAHWTRIKEGAAHDPLWIIKDLDSKNDEVSTNKGPVRH